MSAHALLGLEPRLATVKTRCATAAHSSCFLVRQLSLVFGVVSTSIWLRSFTAFGFYLCYRIGSRAATIWGELLGGSVGCDGGGTWRCLELGAERSPRRVRALLRAGPDLPEPEPEPSPPGKDATAVAKSRDPFNP